MVQISTRVLVAALAAAPALAAPFTQPATVQDLTSRDVELDARSPFIGKIFRKVGGFLGFGRDFEDEIDARDFGDIVLSDVEARELDDFMNDLSARHLSGELDAREFSEMLDTRSPFIGKLFRKVGGFLGFGRDFDEEIDARDFDDMSEIDARELDELLDARSPFIGKLFRKVGGFLGFGRDFDEVLDARAFDDLTEVEAREFDDFVSDLAARELAGELDARAFAEMLDARSPFIGKILGKVGGFLGFARDLDEELDARDFDDLMDFEAREFDIEDFDARDFDEEFDAREFFDFEDFEAREIDELD